MRYVHFELVLLLILYGIGDERPCSRCIKRGIADQCQDGVRKKAKYLHDAPPEALIPPNLGGTYNLATNKSSTTTITIPGSSMSQPSPYYQTSHNPNLDLYSQPHSQIQIPHGIPSTASSFGAQTPISPSFNVSQPGTQMPVSQSHIQQPGQTQYAFDPSDPALYNLDIGNFNFVNQYGALEFGMLNHMSSRVNDVGNDVMTPINQNQNPFNVAFQTTQQDNSLLFPRDAMLSMDYSSTRQPTGSVPPLQTPHNTPIISSVDRNDITSGPYAFAIAARPNSLASASPDPEPTTVGESASSPALFATEPRYTRQSQHQPVQPPPGGGVTIDALAPSQSSSSRKRPPPSADYIYSTVTKGYSYTEGFHRLQAFLKKHYRRDKRNRIASAMSSVRPALITFAQTLTEKDLVFMEIGVQRTLYEYNDFIRATATPTIVARRDFSIAAVNEEFCIMTGWSKNVMLGKHLNRNINRGAEALSSSNSFGDLSEAGNVSNSSGGPNGTTSSTYTVTANQSAPSSVFLAEIMDHDTMVQFVDDWAKLAFNNPKGTGNRRGMLLKYRAPEDAILYNHKKAPSNSSRPASRRNSRTEDVKPLIKEEEGIANEGAMRDLGEPDGMVDCMYSWFLRRDTFECPQLIIMHVSLGVDCY
jgi:transcription activator of gluconeogenesis